MCTFWSNKF